MTDNLVIRPYADGDFETVAALWRETDLTQPWNDAAADVALCRRSEGSELLIGEREGKIVATIMVGHDGHRGWLYYLGVDPAHGRQGIGRRMVGAAEAWLDERAVPKIQLMIRETNLDVQAFYRRLGYEDNPCHLMQRWLDEDAGQRASQAKATQPARRETD